MLTQSLCIQIRLESCRAWREMPALKSVMAVWNLTCGNYSNSPTLHLLDFSNLAEQYLMVIIGQLGWDAESVWRVEMKMIKYPFDLVSFSASSVEYLNCQTAGKKSPTELVSPSFNEDGQEESTRSLKCVPSVLLLPHLLSSGANRWSRSCSNRQPEFNLRWPLLSSDPPSSGGMLLMGVFNIPRPCVSSNVAMRH